MIEIAVALPLLSIAHMRLPGRIYAVSYLRVMPDALRGTGLPLGIDGNLV